MLNAPLVDAHLHLWDPTRLRYPWLQQVPALNRPYSLADYNMATSGLNVLRMVFLQCDCDVAQSRDEVQWVTELADVDRRIEGIVAWAPLEKGSEARSELEWLATNKLVKGCRRIIQSETDSQFCLRDGFIEGVRLLAEFGFSFDICILNTQLSSVMELVRRCPEVQFILDHLGKPNIRERQIEPWRAELRSLAALPNACCKISGTVTEADLANVRREDVAPYIEHAIECFGPNRILFGSDWPVVNLACSLNGWVEMVSSVTETLSDSERHRMFCANAIRFYRLADSAPS